MSIDIDRMLPKAIDYVSRHLRAAVLEYLASGKTDCGNDCGASQCAHESCCDRCLLRGAVDRR